VARQGTQNEVILMEEENKENKKIVLQAPEDV